MKKVTINENFGLVLEFLRSNNAPAEMVDFILDRQAKNSKKSATVNADGEKVLTKSQLANQQLFGEVVEFLNDGVQRKATDIAKNFDVSVQKMSALLKKYSEKGFFIRTQVKKEIFWSIAPTE